MSNNAPSSHSDEEPPPPQDLSASGLTIPSDSEAFSSLSPPSTSPPQSSSHTNDNNNNDSSREQRVVIYSRPTFWSLVRGAAINLLLPFVNGMMLGLGELLAHEIAFRWGWGTTQVSGMHGWMCWSTGEFGEHAAMWIYRTGSFVYIMAGKLTLLLYSRYFQSTDHLEQSGLESRCGKILWKGGRGKER